MSRSKHNRLPKDHFKEPHKESCKYRVGSMVSYAGRKEEVLSVGNFESGAAFVWLSESGPVFSSACEYQHKG